MSSYSHNDSDVPEVINWPKVKIIRICATGSTRTIILTMLSK